MPRIRTVKPSLFRHEGLFEAEQYYKLPLALAFIGLFTICDREGRFRWRPREIKLDIFPYHEINMSDVLDALAEREFIVKYQVGKEIYGYIPTWHKHQAINSREAASAIPSPPQNELIDSSISINNNELDRDVSTYNDNLSIPKSLDICMHVHAQEEKEREGKGKEEERKGEGSVREGEINSQDMAPDPDDPPSLVAPKVATSRSLEKNSVVLRIFEHWKTVMQHPNAKLDAKRKRVILRELNNYSEEQICQAITGCSFTPHNMGQNDQGQRYDDIGLILRDAAHIERFIGNFNRKVKKVSTENTWRKEPTEEEKARDEAAWKATMERYAARKKSDEEERQDKHPRSSLKSILQHLQPTSHQSAGYSQ